ncbi:DNA topoisomerase IV subunit A [Halapricum hydrolyticum]|uniref:Type 2 DNA topoisomerase 6 subunit A n=1 Tax=Halapricum hydrolyticum TaxID=2979991 RepID=A0AAE3I9U4_9EURY|nr:DNA topoisomerase IV subunit A [Halapricum hydrolyticum]MCU4717170.1 DNA topoisomerase IV subunit A [Halapricum hydrolyticum]MCU4726097.1 DNA topoisomerase IV subunit A [Halapricum hydrolyticum]
MSADDHTNYGEGDARQRLLDLAEQFYEQFEDGDVPRLQVPTRTKTNIEYDEDSGVWVYGDRTSTRSAKTVSGAQKLLKAVYTIDFLAQQLGEDRSSTLRELYYLSESWDLAEAQFNSQDESNQLIEDLEIVSGVTREDFHMRPEESGATLMGPLLIREQTRRGEREIHCQEDVGEGGYQIPNNPDQIEFLENDADFVLAVETGGMRDRLVENGFDEEHNALIVHLKGQPARATRRITKRLHDELDLPVTVFTDGDPWSYRIYGSVAYGSIKSAHLSEYLATPQAQFVGVQPEDIVEYDLPTDPLSDSDINALESELEDPRFQTDYWREQIELQLDIEKKSEQQALASHGLDFVTETYLPERLEAMDVL